LVPSVIEREVGGDPSRLDPGYREAMHITVGSITIHPIADGTAVLHPTMFTSATETGRQPADWQHYRQHLDPAGNLVIPVGGFLVRPASPRCTARVTPPVT
jgi:hypothetical protein